MSEGGTPFKITREVAKSLGHVERHGTANILSKEGKIFAEVQVGSTWESKIEDNPPPEASFSTDNWERWAEAFILGDYGAANKEFAMAMGEDITESQPPKSEDNILKGAEKNVEYCFLGAHDHRLGDMISNHKSMILLNPSIGTISRLAKFGYFKSVTGVEVFYDMDADYLFRLQAVICGVMGENEIKVRKVRPADLDRTKFYYLSFNGSLGEKLKIPNYLGFEPNFYQLTNLDKTTRMDYNDNGYRLEYKRYGMTRSVTQEYGSGNFVYGSDGLYERYRNSKYMKNYHYFIHDLWCSERIYDRGVGIVLGRCELVNSFGLIGKYYHRGKRIFTKVLKNDEWREYEVYRNDGINHASKKLSHIWTPLDSAGHVLRHSSYVISAFSSVCCFLGEKVSTHTDGSEPIVKVKSSLGVDIITEEYLPGLPDYGLSKQILYGDTTEFVAKIVRPITSRMGSFQKSTRGNYKSVPDGAKYVRVFPMPQNVHLHQKFDLNDYSVGTYDSVIRRSVATSTLVRDIEDFFT
jgi:hypothetical protein